jgi:hypothetical protein
LLTVLLGRTIFIRSDIQMTIKSAKYTQCSLTATRTCRFRRATPKALLEL